MYHSFSYYILFQLVTSKQHLMITNAYKSELQKNLMISVLDCHIIISKQLDIGQRKISNVISEYNNYKTVTSPCKMHKKNYKDMYDDFELNMIRWHVHSFWFNKTIPTLDKYFNFWIFLNNNYNSLQNISNLLSNLHCLLKCMNFVYRKRNRNGAQIKNKK